MRSRRDFLKLTGAAAGGAVAALAGVESARAATGPHLDPDRVGVLCDFTLCIGCRRCEWACAQRNHLPHGELRSYDDTAVFADRRRPDSINFTVINRYPARGDDQPPFFAKVNCLHCEHPACVSGCIVKALEKSPQGPVTYDPGRCIGCRYCMVACPFQIPSYEYMNATTPVIRKCSLCAETTLGSGALPACVEICPQEAMVYGRRDQLLDLARRRIANAPGRYVDHIYGEREAGGTSWLYLADRSFPDLDLPALAPESPATVTETLQHGIFKGFTGPIMLFGLLSVIMKSAGRHPDDRKEQGHE
ncbi:MAG TPA: 4Fe-4S dicluster domain-containing protein [Candidatus Krumholzibacteria bacterium]|nr:4Fe-4S dicluster domain-containing protein [Candidatus Krumholzibacteria bacterium]HPD73063.1 4Fe-4S dicluster domain-containing protein [Candidatus Krumholzibacteria bacterium]HRY41863.1 4Fe-4S dicluster domain-containing protein [Candidatus Krumholzibacteria bacterium]